MAILKWPLLIFGAFVVIVVVILLLIFGGGDDDGGGGGGSSGESSSGTIRARELKVGDCITDANSRTGDVTTFEAVACDKPHDGEVYTLIRLRGGPKAKPHSEAFINGKGQRGCRARLRRQATRKAFRDPQLGFKFVYPTPASWREGDRDITCVATFKKPRSKKLAQRSRED